MMSEHDEDTLQGIDAALDFISRGWYVVPIKSGTKRPRPDDWVNVATTDPDQVRKWWDRNPDDGVGIVTGPKSGFFVLDIDVSEGKRGDDSLAELEQKHGQLPATVETVTGSGGRHILFKYPEGLEIRNGNSLPPDIDLRGTGGQIVAPGSTHPDTGNKYVWEISSHPDDVPIAEAPSWLLDYCKPKIAVDHTDDVSRSEWSDHPVAAQRYDARATNESVANVLVKAGWEIDYVDKNGVVYVRRPGKNKGFSASIGKVATGVMFNFSSSVLHFEQDTPYDPFGVLAYAHYATDMAAADAYLVDEGWGCASHSLDHEASWELWQEKILDRAEKQMLGDFMSLDKLWDYDYKPPKATALVKVDDKGGVYPNGITALVGEPESGKSWIAQYICAEQMKLGHRIMYWDFESNENSWMNRIKLMGVDREDVSGSFYIKAMSVDEASINVVCRHIKDNDIKFIVIDSVNRIMGRAGLNYESGPDYVKFTTMALDPLDELGCSVIVLDHVVKAKENRGRYATGSEQKLGQIDLSLHLETIHPFAPGMPGTIGIRVAKDRHGAVRQDTHGTGELRRWGLFHLGEDLETGMKEITIEPWIDPAIGPPTDKTFRKHWPSQLLKAITDCIIDLGPMSEFDLKFWIDCKAAEFDYCLKLLMDESYIVKKESEDGRQLLQVPVKGYNPKTDKRALEYEEGYGEDV